MRLEFSIPFDPGCETNFEVIPAAPAVFALFPAAAAPPYLSHSKNLRRRLGRLLGCEPAATRRLNLRAITTRVEFQLAGSNFEAQWLLFLLNRFHYPRQFRKRLRLKPPALLKINLANRFPRCYPTQRLVRDGSLYYGPFPSRAAAERFAAGFLDFFKIRRCLPDLAPDPSHPGCVYSQMRMCLAPCYQGCTDEEYRQEVSRVAEFLSSAGATLVRQLEAERCAASENLEFERAGRAHARLEKVQDVLRLRAPLAREISNLDAIVVLPGAKENRAVFFTFSGGELAGPATLALEENVPQPLPLDQRLQSLLAPLLGSGGAASPDHAGERALPWEPLSLLARWYYSSFREGDLLMLSPGQPIPYRRLVRLCRKVTADPRRIQ
ncbi:MAG: hypothetical protein ACRD1N_03275 [Terriglobia bacterium]